MTFADRKLILADMDAFIRTTSFCGFHELVTKLGGNPAQMLQRFHIQSQFLQEADATVPLRSLVELLEYAARELNCSDFGLRMAEYQNLQVLGPIAVMARNSASVEHALRDIVRFIGYHSSGIELDLDLSLAQSPRLIIGLRLPSLLPQRQMLELAMGVAYKAMKLLCGTHFRAQAVLLCAVSGLPTAHYRRYFKTEVCTGQSCNALVMTQQQLNQGIEAQDPNVHRTLVQYFEHVHGHSTVDLIGRVHRVVSRLLPTQQCRLPIIAQHLGIHERALQRQLAERQQRFDQILDKIRRERADYYLKEQSIPISQIAGMLGYSEQSVFNRASRRWFAATPGERRRQLLALPLLSND
ncbi:MULTISPECIES: AraC family transcriptional regulator [unclassified Pseudomonas]|uniref:AraC family transcriptional regulator n=1 Tax=unclassified Pseudomonas TaxID=196821 RepID=UPI001F4FEEA5|nr:MULTISPECIES: AraC family transcriptional regulator [unclassified Pseudomonas]